MRKTRKIYVMLCPIWYHLYNFKHVQNTHNRCVTFSYLTSNFTKTNTLPWVYLTFFKLHKWCQIAQSITYYYLLFRRTYAIFWQQWRIQSAFDAGIPVWAHRLMKNSLEKISFIPILGDKICIAIVSKMYVNIAGNLTLLGIFVLFFFKKKQSQLFSCYIFTSFYFQFWTGSSVRFVHGYWFSLNIFRLEAINPRNIQAWLKDSLNVIVKLFPRGLYPVN